MEYVLHVLGSIIIYGVAIILQYSSTLLGSFIMIAVHIKSLQEIVLLNRRERILRRTSSNLI